jgi:hypothetical protein
MMMVHIKKGEDQTLNKTSQQGPTARPYYKAGGAQWRSVATSGGRVPLLVGRNFFWVGNNVNDPKKMYALTHMMTFKQHVTLLKFT